MYRLSNKPTRVIDLRVLNGFLSFMLHTTVFVCCINFYEVNVLLLCVDLYYNKSSKNMQFYYKQYSQRNIMIYSPQSLFFVKYISF